MGNALMPTARHSMNSIDRAVSGLQTLEICELRLSAERVGKWKYYEIVQIRWMRKNLTAEIRCSWCRVQGSLNSRNPLVNWNVLIRVWMLTFESLLKIHKKHSELIENLFFQVKQKSSICCWRSASKSISTRKTIWASHRWWRRHFRDERNQRSSCCLLVSSLFFASRVSMWISNTFSSNLSLSSM